MARIVLDGPTHDALVRPGTALRDTLQVQIAASPAMVARPAIRRGSIEQNHYEVVAGGSGVLAWSLPPLYAMLGFDPATDTVATDAAVTDAVAADATATDASAGGAAGAETTASDAAPGEIPADADGDSVADACYGKLRRS